VHGTSPPVLLQRVRRRESSSRIVRLLAPLISLNTATNKQSAISLRNRGTADRGLLVAGIGLPALMNRLGHVEPDMAMRYLDVTLTDLKREFQLASSKQQHLTPQPNPPVAPLRTGAASVQHVPKMVRRTLPAGATRPSSTALQPAHKNRRGKERRAQLNPRLRRRLTGKARHPTGIRGASRTSKQDLN